MTNIFSRILVAIDDCDASKAALTYATRLASEHGAQLVICHSVNWLPIIAQIASSDAFVDITPIVDDLKAEGEALLDRASEMAKRAGVQAKRLALEGEPAKNILEQAAEAKCGVIVMGTHGRQGLERLFVGSTTEAVLRESTIPVLTVRPGITFAAPGKRCFERIVIGIDESGPSIAALETVLGLPPEDRQYLVIYSVARATDEEQDQAHRIIGKAVSMANARGISAKGRVITGHPDEALIAAAQRSAADLIVLGSHGRQGLHRLFLGSVAEGVVRKSPVPVLVVRTRADVPVAEGAQVAAPVAVSAPSPA